MMPSTVPATERSNNKKTHIAFQFQWISFKHFLFILSFFSRIPAHYGKILWPKQINCMYAYGKCKWNFIDLFFITSFCVYIKCTDMCIDVVFVRYLLVSRHSINVNCWIGCGNVCICWLCLILIVFNCVMLCELGFCVHHFRDDRVH